jgi:secondary thiamine-phosphate synthase enzyme
VTVASGLLRVGTSGEGDVLDLSAGLESVLRTSGVRDGAMTVLVEGSTAAVTTIEFEPGLVADLRALLERLVPAGSGTGHDTRNGDDNGHAHLRAALLGPSVSVPVVGGRLVLGTWQQVVLLELDTRPRDRVVHVQIVGE